MATARRPPPGLYDEPITAELEEALASLSLDLREIESLHAGDAPRLLARLLNHRLLHALQSFPSEQSLDRQVRLTNKLLELIAAEAPDGGAEERLAPPARRLLAVRTPPETALGKAASPVRPRIPLSSSDLIVNGHHDVSLGPELKRELASADRVDLLCSFLKWSGLRLVRDELAELLRRRPGSLRVLTTAYMATTERRALDELVAIGADVRVSYDISKTRLHAKAWLFHRASGFSTACIGSSNLSAAAMLDGLEWNVRLSLRDNGPILEKFAATFEQYWADPDFRKYDAEEFDSAVTQQRRDAAQPFFAVDVLPRPHQQEILDDLEAERGNGFPRNLVVAATGTGKTIVAALDYRRLRSAQVDTLLFVAHREEILRQSLHAFRAVLRDGAFGELLVGDQKPLRGRHVFASIQSLRGERLTSLAKDAFDMVIVDEFHHAAADTYDDLLAHLKPKLLLGLTATPERADGRSVLHHFGGRIASELRLWKALDQGLLSPFQYFGVGGGPDLSGVRWERGRYDARELSNLFSANDVFALRVRQELVRRVRDVHSMRAFGFCVDIAHAEFMARSFNAAGVKARAVSADTTDADRKRSLTALASGEIQIVFSVDLFNEGIDVPDIDTVLFLRPTESATIFLQQLGRGLRKSARKECLTVLDFIGDANRSFRFDLRYRAIVGGTRNGILREVQDGFPTLPSGCVIELDPQSQESVLRNIKAALGLGRSALVEDLKAMGPHASLASFLRETDLELEDVYSNDWSFSRLRRKAGFDSQEPDERGLQVERALGRLLHLNDRLRLHRLRAILEQPTAPRASADDVFQRLLFILLGNARLAFAEMANAWAHLWAHPSLRTEVIEVLQVLESRARLLERRLDGRLADRPLILHAAYTRDEVMTAFDLRATSGAVKQPREGVVGASELNPDLFFVTLEKSESDYTPSTMYNDYPISPRRFHWQSQAHQHEGTPTGRRHLATKATGAHQALLFVRQRITDERGETLPYVNLGPVTYVSHTGARPMSIEWELAHEMPMWLYQETKRAAG